MDEAGAGGGFEVQMRVALGQGGGTAARLADRAVMSRDQARRTLAKLEAAGEVVRWRRPGTRAWIWVLKTQGDDVR